MAAAQASEHLMVLGLPSLLSDDLAHRIFSQYGTVEQAKMLEAISGASTRGCLLQMSTLEEAAWLVQNVNTNIPQGLEAPVTIQFVAMSGAAAANGIPSAPAAPAAPPAQLQFAGPFQVGLKYKGTVKRWDDTKGFGFIVPEGGGPDVFVHTRELIDGDKLVNGSQVIFEVMQDPTKGPNHFRAKTCKGAVTKEACQYDTVSVNEKVFMTGLPLDVTEGMITQVFGQYGSVVSVKKMPIQAGKTDAAALVLMGSVSQAEYLVKSVDRSIPPGLTQPVFIKFAENGNKVLGRSAAAQMSYGATPGFSSAPPPSTAGFSFGI